MFYQTQTTCRPPKGMKNAVFLSLVTLTFDLDIQTGLSKRPNTSSTWIWCKSVQWLRRNFIHKQTKGSQTVPKTEPYTVHCVQ